MHPFMDAIRNNGSALRDRYYLDTTVAFILFILLSCYEKGRYQTPIGYPMVSLDQFPNTCYYDLERLIDLLGQWHLCGKVWRS